MFRSADSTVRLWGVSTSCNEGESLDTTEEGILQHSQTTSEHNDILWTSWRVKFFFILFNNSLMVNNY